jgi:hypothetical protein
VAALAGTGLTAGRVEAQSIAFGTGGEAPQLVYRNLMDCLYWQAQGSPGFPPKTPKATNCPAFNQSGVGGLILPAPTSPNNGKLVFLTNNIANLVPNLNAVTYTDSTVGVWNTNDYDGVQFAFNDDVVNAADVAAWNAAGNPATYGNIIQIPTLIYTIGIGVNGTDGNGAPLNIVGSPPTSVNSGLNLSRTALCGIVSGHVTKWNNWMLTVSNGGVTLGFGNITFVHRAESSVISFLLSNALAEQCRNEFGPMNEANPTIVSYAFPWTDRAASCAGLPLPTGANLSNWPDQFPFDQCGNVVANPGGGHFANGTRDAGMVTTIRSINGALGYGNLNMLAPFSVKGVSGIGPKAANLQSQWDLTASTGQFQPPTAQGGQAAMASGKPLFTAAERANPLQ